MAIRVTKHGALPDHDVFAGTCYRCKTEVEFERVDARLTSDQRDGDYLSVDCPVCGDAINVAASHPLRKAVAR